MTSDQEREFEHQWPALAARVNRLMRRKKISPWLAEDLTQETGLRLIGMWPKIDQTQPLWPLVATIALNLMRDEMRRDGSHELTYAVPDVPSQENVERRGMARLELRAVGGALSQMTDRHRHALLAEVSDAPDGAPDASATRMLRMRARRKLQNLLDHASLLGIALGDHLRRMIREAELVISKVLPSQAEHVTAAAISLLAALSVGIAVAPDAPSAAGEIENRSGSTSAGDLEPGWSTASHGNSHVTDGPTTSGRAARRGDAVGRRDRDGERRGGSGDRGFVGGTGEETPFPGALDYQAHVSDDTYISGSLEAEVVGEDDFGRSVDGDSPQGAGNINCTVSPASSGASCSHSGEGWSERGIRAQHEGEAVVAGRRVY